MGSGLQKVLDVFRAATEPSDGRAQLDSHLLTRFFSERDQAAFALLIRRHGPMVFGVCRRLLGNYHDAEEAFQATFMVLAHSGTKIRQMSVGSWLHTVAYRAALAARKSQALRRRFEKQVESLPERGALPRELMDWLPILDLALIQLAEKHREPIILCDLEGRSRDQVARQLGIPPGTLSSRLNRARTILAKRLRQHGVILSSAAIGSILSESAQSAVSRDLVVQTHKAAWLISTGRAVTPLTAPGDLMNGVLNTMIMAQFSYAFGVACAIAVLAAGGLSFQLTTFGAAQTKNPQSMDFEQSAIVPSQSEKAADLLKTVVEGFRANQQAIRSLHVKLHIKTDQTGAAGLIQHNERYGEWWEQGGKIRWTEQLNEEGESSRVFVNGHPRQVQIETIEDCFVENGKSYNVRTRREVNIGESSVANIQEDTFPRLGFVDVWSRLGFVVHERPRLLVIDVLENPDWTKEVRRTDQRKEELVEVLCRKNAETVRLLMSPKQGYLVKHLEVRRESGPGEAKRRLALEIDGIQKHQSGAYLPTHVLRTIQAEESPRQTKVTNETFVDLIEVNQPLPNGCLESPIEEGMRTIDRIAQLRYTMGPDGKPSPDFPKTPIKIGVPVKLKP